MMAAKEEIVPMGLTLVGRRRTDYTQSANDRSLRRVQLGSGDHFNNAVGYEYGPGRPRRGMLVRIAIP